jgi:hypothetical protein
LAGQLPGIHVGAPFARLSIFQQDSG